MLVRSAISALNVWGFILFKGVRLCRRPLVDLCLHLQTSSYQRSAEVTYALQLRAAQQPSINMWRKGTSMFQGLYEEALSISVSLVAS